MTNVSFAAGRRSFRPAWLPSWFHRPHWSWRRWAVLGSLGGLGTVLTLFTVVYAAATVPSGSDFAIRSTMIVDRNGKPIAQLHAEIDRVDIPLAKVVKVMRDATVAAEDHDFFSHNGVDLRAILRAAISDVLHPSRIQGGSTITQQYVKNAFVGNERSLRRKITEAAVAIKLERSVSKEMILERYLNTIYFGRGAYGIQAASLAFFGGPAERLSIEQAAYLAGSIRAPEIYGRDPKAAQQRRDTVVGQMVDLKMISKDEGDVATKKPLRFVPQRAGAISTIAPHFVQDVRAELIDRFGEDELYRGGITVTTTLDLAMQKAAERAVAGTLDRADDPNAALISLDPASGGIRAEVGGRDFSKSQVNVVSSVPGRQPGSAFKPFVLAAGLTSGTTLRERFRAPATITIPTDGKPWTLSNYDRKDYGTIDLIDATRSSVNTVFAQVIAEVGPARVVTAARAAGIDSKIRPMFALALGTEVVRPLELAAAYQTLATGGTYRSPYAIEKVVDRFGSKRYVHAPDDAFAMSPAIASAVTYALRQVIERGTGRSAVIGRPAAGKTGTTEEHQDAWFAGYTPNLVTVVWMGFNDGKTNMRNVRGIAVTGGSFPAAIWRRFMVDALVGMAVAEFPAFDPSPAPTVSTITPSPSPSASSSPKPRASIIIPSPSQSASPTPTPTSSPSSSPSPSPTPTPT